MNKNEKKPPEWVVFFLRGVITLRCSVKIQSLKGSTDLNIDY